MAVALTFAAVSGLLAPLSHWTLPGGQPRSPGLCAAACLGNLNCGGIFFNASQMPSCWMVVDASVAGATKTSSISRLVFRISNYRDVYRLFEVRLDGLRWWQAEQKCLDANMGLPPHPKSMRERAALSLREGNFFYIDMQRKANGEYARWSTQEIIPESEMFEWLPKNPNYGDEPCLGMGEAPIVFYDYSCNMTDSPMTLLCVY